jgi:hypothetical protein
MELLGCKTDLGNIKKKMEQKYVSAIDQTKWTQEYAPILEKLKTLLTKDSAESEYFVYLFKKNHSEIMQKSFRTKMTMLIKSLCDSTRCLSKSTITTVLTMLSASRKYSAIEQILPVKIVDMAKIVNEFKQIVEGVPCDKVRQITDGICKTFFLYIEKSKGLQIEGDIDVEGTQKRKLADAVYYLMTASGKQRCTAKYVSKTQKSKLPSNRTRRKTV